MGRTETGIELHIDSRLVETFILAITDRHTGTTGKPWVQRIRGDIHTIKGQEPETLIQIDG